LQREVQICVVGKVFRPNKSKVLALNKTLSEYFKLVKWYLSCNSKSKKFLHEKCYEDAKRLFNLNTALIRTARDKAVEILKSFEKRCGLIYNRFECMHKHSPCLNERHGMGSLALNRQMRGKGVKPPLTPEAPGFSRGAAHIWCTI
jgi:hypothetical protein